MEEDLFNRKRRNSRQREPRKDSLFGWTIGIILLIGMALGCWMASFYIFGHPEKPFSYSVLQKLGKIDPPRRFEITKAPKGRFLTAKALYERYGSLPNYELKNLNAQLLRDYLTNYTQITEKLPYVVGTYAVLDSFELRDSDTFKSGVVALGQADDFPMVLIEHLYTADTEAVPILERMLLTGLSIKLKRTVDLSTIAHISRLEDGRMIFTLVPLLYGSYTINDGASTFNLRPPRTLNLEGAFPIVTLEDRKRAEQRYADYRRERGLPAIVAMPVATQEESDPATPAIPIPTGPAPVATPLPVTASGPQTVPARALPPTAPLIALATPTPPPTRIPAVPTQPAVPLPPSVPAGVPVAVPATPATAPVPVPAVPAVPAPNTVAVTPTPVRGVPVKAVPVAPAPAPTSAAPLKPFITSTGQAHAPAVKPAGSWETYSPGQMPRAPLLNVSDAKRMARSGTGGKRLYLQGNFVVKASGARKTVVRPRGGDESSTRVIVEYPPGVSVPSEGTPVRRDSMRPYEIRRIEQRPDGQTNVYVREITR